MGGTLSLPETKWFPEFEEKLPSLEGKTVAITGCTSGTGLVAAKTSAKKGAKNVLMLNRPSPRAEKAEEEVARVAASRNTHVETIPCDLQDFESVERASDHIKSKYDSIDVLCNNAGVMALEDYATKDGYDVQMQTNHLSHFKLTSNLLPLLKRAAELRGEARIVNHSSAARHNGGPLEARYFERQGGNLGGNGGSLLLGGAKWERYHQTKLANSVWTGALKSYLQGTGIKAVCCAPGAAVTNLADTASNQGALSGMMWIQYFAQTAEDGTMPLLAACFDPTTQSGDFWEPAYRGRLIGPAIKVPLDKSSQDPELHKLLWNKSEEAAGKFFR